MKVLRVFFLLSYLTFFTTNYFAQSLLELIPGSYKLVYSENLKAQRLIGNVNFVYQGNKMYCDSAYYYEKTSEVKAFGKVHINKNDSLNLFCDSLYYNGKTKLAKLWGHVRVRDREYKLSTDTLEYDAKKNVAIYHYGGTIENSFKNEKIISINAYLYPNSKNLFFSKNVHYKSDSLEILTDTLQFSYLKQRVSFFGKTKIYTKKASITCNKGWYNVQTEEGLLRDKANIKSKEKYIYSDSIYYFPNKGIAEGRQNSIYYDTLEKFLITGNYFYKNDSLKKLIVYKQPLIVFSQKNDSIFMLADTIHGITDSLGKVKNLLAYRNGKIYKNSFQAISDSIIYSKISDEITLVKEPKAWTKNAQLAGDTMVISLKDSSISQLKLRNKCTSVIQLDTGTYYNQIAGKYMTAFLNEQQELIRIYVKNNAQTIYFPEDTLKSDSIVEIKRTGMSRIYASELRIDLDSSEISRIVYIDKPDAVFYPIDKINKEEQRVSHFTWTPFLRPNNKNEFISRFPKVDNTFFNKND